MSPRHYLDHASTSPLRREVVAAMARWLEEPFGDPGRIHAEGREARVAIEQSRDSVATLLGTRPRQVVFTSGGTEAVNAACWGAVRARPGRPVVLAEVEHSCVREASERLAPQVVVPVDSTGRIDPAAVEETLERCESTGELPALVHCQAVNHEVGTLQPIGDVVEVCRRRSVWVHVDACAAVGHVPLAADDLGADFLSVSAHKLGGPPGAGALVLRRGLRVDPFLVGGEQERGRRAGMENLISIAGFGAAAEVLSHTSRLAAEANAERMLVEHLEAVASGVEDVEILGDRQHRAPHILCISINGLEAEPVLLVLDHAGIAAHSGSSCSSESLAPSPVLAAMGVDPDRSLRLSVGWSSTEQDVDAFAKVFPTAVTKLRELQTQIESE